MLTNQLYQYRDVKKEIDHIEEQLKRLESRMYSPRAGVLSDMPKATGFVGDQMADIVIKHEALFGKYKNLLNRLYEQQLNIENFIETLDPIERDLIRCRYIEGMKWKYIFKEIGYSPKQTFRIHDKILKKLKKMTQHDIK